MKRAAVALVLSLVPLIVMAQTAPADFARGAGIRTEGGSIFRVLLPDDLYETVVRADLGDIRVLNATGAEVPHTLRRVPLPAAADAEWRAVPSFPMSAVQTGGPARTQVRVDANGAVLEVTGDAARKATTAYLVDVSAIDDPVLRLALTWTAPAGVTFLARVMVQASNDLDAWRTLVASAALAQLRRDTFVLTQNEIELPESAGRTRYLRISWPTELAAATLTAVRVRPRTAAAPAEIRWRTLSPAGAEPSGPPLYDARAQLPVEYVDLEFQDVSDAAEVTVLSRATPEAAWQARHRGLFYSLQEATGAIRSEPARTAPTLDRYWSLQRADGREWAPARAPRLKVGWHPHEIVFVAQGAAPFTLAYGSARVGPADAPVEALLARLDESDRTNQVRTATLDSPRTLGGADALTPPTPVRRLVLWGVLVAAVVVLAFLAFRLFRDTNTADRRPIA